MWLHFKEPEILTDALVRNNKKQYKKLCKKQ